MHCAVSCCVMGSVTGEIVCAVPLFVDSAVSQAIQRTPLQALGKHSKATGIDISPTLIDVVRETLQYCSSQCCLHDLSKLIQPDGSGNSKQRAIRTAS